MDKIITIKTCLPSMQSLPWSHKECPCAKEHAHPVLAKFNYLNEHPPVSYGMVSSTQVVRVMGNLYSSFTSHFTSD